MNIQEINKKLITGFISLSFRRAILLAINFITINLILARILPVETIGVFNIANSILSFFTFFSDVGLAAALIQKKEITHDDLRTTFTIQEILAFIIMVTVWFLAPIVAPFYHLDQSGVGLVRALGFAFFLTSIKVIPSILLERELKFQPLVVVEVLETLVFNSLLVILSLRNFSVDAFSWSSIARGLVGVTSIYLISPWKVSVGVSRVSLRSLFSFGIPFQLNSILALLKDRLVPLVIAQMIGPIGVGLLTWAQNLAFLPLEVMNIVIRVTFPAFSRLQDDEKALSETIEKSLFAISFFLYPLLFGLLAVAPALIEHVVSNKWQAALPLVYLFSFSTFWASLSTTFTNVFNASGKISITLKLMIMWTVLTWALSPILTYLYGFIGAALASAIISFTSIVPIIIIKRMLKVEIIKNIWQPLISSIFMSVAVFFISRYLVYNFASLLVTILIGAIIYFAIMILIAKNRIFELLGKFVHVPA